MLSLPSILELYINCWECFDDVLPFADNLTLLGCGSYSFERYLLINNIYIYIGTMPTISP